MDQRTKDLIEICDGLIALNEALKAQETAIYEINQWIAANQ